MTVEEFEKKDNSFNSNEFISKANNMIKKLYNAITLDKLDTVDHFASDNVFNKFKEELENAKKNNLRLIYDQVNIVTKITDIEEDNDTYKVICSVTCKFYKYYETSTKKIIDKDDFRTVEEHEAIFCKRIGSNRSKVARCLGCSTPLNINNNGKCPSCGRIYDLELFDYYLDEYE